MAERRSVSYAEQNKQLTADRKTNPFLAKVNSNACQRTLRRLDKAFAAFFRLVKAGEKRCGYPRFRGQGRFDSVEYTAGDGAKLVGVGHVRIMEAGLVKICLDRPVEGTAKTITFKREADHWYVVLSCVLDVPAPAPSKNPAVGIDLGLKSFLVTSTGESVAAPQFFRKSEKALARAQRRLSREKRGSANRKKAVLRVARLHRFGCWVGCVPYVAVSRPIKSVFQSEPIGVVLAAWSLTGTTTRR